MEHIYLVGAVYDDFCDIGFTVWCACSTPEAARRKASEIQANATKVMSITEADATNVRDGYDVNSALDDDYLGTVAIVKVPLVSE